uniref:Putative secreted protein n=1 Tax=Ixodes ricinus TaxID=34613 RepID=A0A6B0ULV0_IXORI
MARIGGLLYFVSLCLRGGPGLEARDQRFFRFSPARALEQSLNARSFRARASSFAFARTWGETKDKTTQINGLLGQPVLVVRGARCGGAVEARSRRALVICARGRGRQGILRSIHGLH